MKNRLLLVLSFLLALSTSSAQWNVSTEISNKNVLIEEYTGIHCGYCPYAHKIVNELLKVQGDKVYAIAIHAGSFATPGSDQPDFRTVNGNELNNHFGVSNFGYPAGMVNRKNYGTDEEPMLVVNRSLWATYAHLESEETALVNLWMESDYNPDTRELTVNIEGYYTGNVETEENYLTVVVTENNIMGPQSGGGVGDEYIHKHMARAWLTPTLGDAITNCKEGEYFAKQYTYIVPETINDVEVNPAELEIVAFISESDKDVLNVTSSCPDYQGEALPLAAEIADAMIPIGETYGFNYFDIQLTNKSTEDITSASFTVTFNSTDYDVEWSGNAPARKTTTIRLPFDVTSNLKETSNRYTIKLTGLNGTDYKGGRYNGKFDAPHITTPSIKVSIVTDNYADENHFFIKDLEGNIVSEIGPFEAGEIIKTSQFIDLLPNTSYCLEVTDAWTNGINDGSVTIYDANGNLISQSESIINHGYRTFFTTSEYNVSTEIQNKKVLIEEFTGIHCGNCPDAHAIIDELLKAQGDKVYALAYHSGYYATPIPGEEPDYRTSFGDSLDIYFIPDGYPSGMINRQRYDGAIMCNRGLWSTYSHLTSDEIAPVNVWVNSIYDSETSTLTVDVEGYYTANVESEFNLLNVIISQSNIIGPQGGGGMGNNYVHKHMVRDNLTPIWGDTILSCKEGDHFKKQYTYVVPEDINGVPTLPENFEVIAFICQDKEEILNVTGCQPIYPGLVLPLDVKMLEPLIPVTGTYAYNYYEAFLVNNSTEDVVEAGFAITLNNEKYYTEWFGVAPARQTTAIIIPIEQSDLIESANDFEIELLGVNYEYIDITSFSGDFQDPLNTTNTNKFVIKTDNYADENRYLIKDMSGNIVHEFGPFPVGVVSEVSEMLTLDDNKTYCLEILDAWGNGIMSPRGTCKIYNANNKLVAQQLEIKDHGCRIFFSTTEDSAVESLEADNAINVHYNTNNRHIEINASGEIFSASIYNAAGQCVYQASKVQALNVPMTIKGVYVVKVSTQELQQVTKVAVN